MGLSTFCLPPATTFIVTGSSLRAEEKDRPLAYCMQERVKEQLQTLGTTVPVYVLSDFRYLHELHLQEFPTISIGGPGVNALAHKWLEEVPIILEVEDEFFLQMGLSHLGAQQASVWGMDHVTTEAAVATFLDQYLPEFLGIAAEHSAKRA